MTGEKATAPAGARTTWRSWVPGYELIRGFDRRTVRTDIVAALTVTALLIPSGLAYGSLAGLTPVAGLYTGCLGMAGYALFATSRVQIVGPESQMAILVAAALAPLATAGSPAYVTLATLLTILCAALCLLAGVARLGFLADYLSQAVLVGYITGVALIIVVGQLGKLLGFATDGDTLTDLVASVVRNAGQVHGPSLAIGVASVLVMVALRHLAPKLPAALLVVAAMTAASAIFRWAQAGVAVVGSVPRGFPAPQLPTVTWEALAQLAGPAIGITLVVFADTVLTARAYAARAGGYRIDANRELLGLATANLLSGLFRGFPVGASDSRTVVNYEAKGSSQLVSLYAAGITALFLVALTPLVSTLPTPTLAGVVIVAAIGLIRPRDFAALFRFRPFEAVLAALTLLGVAVIGILPGILLAVAVNLLEVVASLSRPEVDVLGPVAGSSRWREVPRADAERDAPSVLVLRYGGPLIFANANHAQRRIRRELRARARPPVWVVLDCEAVTRIDSNGVQSLQLLNDEIARSGARLALARVTGPLQDALDRTDLAGQLRGMVFDRVADAVQNVPPRTISPTDDGVATDAAQVAGAGNHVAGDEAARTDAAQAAGAGYDAATDDGAKAVRAGDHAEGDDDAARPDPSSSP